jgi:TolB protein
MVVRTARGWNGLVPLWACVALLVAAAASRAAEVAVEVSPETIAAVEGSVTRVTRTAYPKFFLTYTPDGTGLCYTRHHANRRAAGLVLMSLRRLNVDGSDDRPLLTAFDAAVQIQEHAAFSPSGQTLLVTGGGNDTGNSAKDVFTATISATGEVGDLRKVIPGPSVNVGEQPSWSPEGTEFVVTTTQKALWVFSADGKSKRRLIQPGGQYCFQPAWSPDGGLIAFASDRDGNSEIYTLRPDGSDLKRLTTEPGIDCRPRWSPDGQWLAFTSNRTGREDVYLLRRDGSDLRPLTAHPAVDDHAAWSPDGQHLAFISLRDGGFDLYRRDVPADLRITTKPGAAVAIGAAPKPAPTPSAAALPGDGLVAHFPFDAVEEGVARDTAGATRFDLLGVRRLGRPGRGVLVFSGEPAHATAAPLDPFHLSEALTVCLWVNPDATGANGYLLSKHGWNIYLGGDMIPRFETRTAANDAWATLPATRAIPARKWSHVAVVFDPTARKMLVYLDGRPAGEQARTDGKLGAADSYSFELGRYNAGKSQYFAGELDSLRVYRRALSAADLARLVDSERPEIGRE